DHAALRLVAVALHADEHEAQRDEHQRVAGDHATAAAVVAVGEHQDVHRDGDDETGDQAVERNGAQHGWLRVCTSMCREDQAAGMGLGCHSSTLRPSGSRMWAKRPFISSGKIFTGSTPCSLHRASMASRSSTTRLNMKSDCEGAR